MSDKYLLDGHKMLWHLDRVADWEAGKSIAPIHIDVGLSKGCNIRCEYCYGVTQGNFFRKGCEIVFPREALLNYMRSAGECGVRSMALIGEAEPTLNPALSEAILEGKKAGVDMALGTNGILLPTDDMGQQALAALTWIRFNISAADDAGYRRIHGSKEFDKAIEKIKFAVQFKKENRLDLTIGLQMVLTPSNVDQSLGLSKLGADLGVDYLVIKQCGDTKDNDLGVFERLSEYKTYTELLKDCEACSNEHYNVIAKWEKLTNMGIRDYDTCFGAPFLLYTSGDGRVYPCGMFFDTEEEKYRMGDLTKNTFKEIIESERYREVVELVKKINVHKKCYTNCRSNSINSFLWKIKNPPEHKNFV